MSNGKRSFANGIIYGEPFFGSAHVFTSKFGRWLLSLLLMAVVPGSSFSAAFQSQAEPTIASVEQKIRSLEAFEGQDATQKAVLDVYRRALEQLRFAEDWQNKASALDKEQKTALKQRNQLKEGLSKPVEFPFPEITPQTPASEINQALTQATSDLNTEQNSLNEFNRKVSSLAERRLGLPALMTEARKKIERYKNELQALSNSFDELSLGKKVLAQANLKAATTELSALELELSSSEERETLSKAQRDLANYRVSQLGELIKQWQATLTANPSKNAETCVVQAQEDFGMVSTRYPALVQLTLDNLKLAEQRVGPSGLSTKINQAQQALGQIKQDRAKLKDSFDRINSKMAALGFTNSLGLFLLQKRASLPNVSQHRENFQSRQTLIADIQSNLLKLEEEGSSTMNLNEQAQLIMSRLDPPPSPEQSGEILETTKKLLQFKESLQKDLFSDYNTYLESLVNLDIEEQALINDTVRFSDYIDEHVLWIRSAPTLKFQDFLEEAVSLRSLFSLSRWKSAIIALCTGLCKEVGLNILSGLAIVFLLVSRKIILQRISKIGQKAPPPPSPVFFPTFLTFFYTLLVSTIWPAALWLIAWRLSLAGNNVGDLAAVASGLKTILPFLGMTEFLRCLCQPFGLAVAHFQWPSERTQPVFKQIFWLNLLALPLLFGSSAFVTIGMSNFDLSGGRVPFLLATVVIGFSTFRLLHPVEGPFASTQEDDHRAIWRGWFWLSLSLGAIGAIGLISSFGFTYASWKIGEKTLVTFLMVVLFWVLRLVCQQWVDARNAQARNTLKISPEMLAGSGNTERSSLDLGLQVYKLVQAGSFFLLVYSLWVNWVDLFPAFKSLQRIELWTWANESTEAVTGPSGTKLMQVTQQSPTTLADLLVALLIVLATFTILQYLPGFLNAVLAKQLPLNTGVRYAFISMVRYGLILTGLIASLSKLGLTWNKVQWLAAAVTVGLGFGLQEIFANFISGIILLFEQPVRVGDIVSIGDVTGKVIRIGARATVVQDPDCKELVIPNKQFITGQLVNWTLSDPTSRVTVSVEIAYGSDTTLVEQLLLKAAQEVPYVLPDPKPTVVFTSFDNGGLNFKLHVFIQHRANHSTVLHNLHLAVNKLFLEAGVVFSFPHMEVQITNFEPGKKTD